VFDPQGAKMKRLEKNRHVSVRRGLVVYVYRGADLGSINVEL